MTALLNSPTFWTLIAFIIFVVLLFRPVKKALLGGLDSRIAQIRTEVEEAQRLREEAQTLLASYQRKQREAVQEAEEIVARAREEAETHRTQAGHQLSELLKRQEALAVEKIGQAETAAMQEVRDVAIDLAIAATEKILAQKVSGDLADKLITDAIDELPRKLQ